MSHFTVLVIGEDHESALAPFQENNMGDCPKQYLEFNDIEDEYRKDYENNTVDMYRCPDGKLRNSWDKYFRIPGTAGIGSDTHKVHEDCELVKVPYNEKFATFEDFMKEWGGYERDEETGKFGYWENPNAKWDWWSVGGRWTGFFKLKDGASGEIGRPGLMTPKAQPGCADQARKKDIDFEAMREKFGQTAARKYDKLHELAGDSLNTFIPWSKMRDEIHNGDIKKAREEYHKQEAVRKISKDKELVFEDIELFLISKEQYVQNSKDKASATFAVIKDGNWYERGEMGWWGIVSNEKDNNKWYSEFSKMLDELPDDTLLTVVDCHI